MLSTNPQGFLKKPFVQGIIVSFVRAKLADINVVNINVMKKLLEVEMRESGSAVQLDGRMYVGMDETV